MKFLIYTGMTIGSIVGTWLGSLIDHDPLLGLWSLTIGGIGAILGILIAYKIGKMYL